MPQSELLAFFRTNTADLPEITYHWFQLPNKAQEAIAKRDRNEIIKRLGAGEEIHAVLGMTPRVTVEAQQFMDRFSPKLTKIVELKQEEKAIQLATTTLEQAGEQFEDDQLSLIRSRIFAARGTAQGYLIDQGSLKHLPYGHKLRSLCFLSAAADFMRADLESRQITDLAPAIAECFGQAESTLLLRKVYERWGGWGSIFDYKDRLKQLPKFSTPGDPEIRNIQREILAKLI